MLVLVKMFILSVDLLLTLSVSLFSEFVAISVLLCLVILCHFSGLIVAVAVVYSSIDGR